MVEPQFTPAQRADFDKLCGWGQAYYLELRSKYRLCHWEAFTDSEDRFGLLEDLLRY